LNYLLDTCVVSEARRNAPAAVAWLSAVNPDALFLSVVTLGEIAKGMAIRQRTDPVAAASLDGWLSGLRGGYADRILAIDDVVAMAWGHLMARRTLPVPDGLIAATARVHNLALVTRNVTDFSDTGVDIVNPWAG
jgi:predicted nucleic acid-binding protein